MPHRRDQAHRRLPGPGGVRVGASARRSLHSARTVGDGRLELPELVRGVFKPAHKTFGFETRRSDLELVLRVLAADCQLEYPGHEIPFLLNRVDLEVRHAFCPQLFERHIRSALASRGEELEFEESDERSWR